METCFFIYTTPLTKSIREILLIFSIHTHFVVILLNFSASGFDSVILSFYSIGDFAGEMCFFTVLNASKNTFYPSLSFSLSIYI